MARFIMLILFFELSFVATVSAETLTLSTMESRPNITRSIERVMTEAYHRIGVDISLVKYQNERAIRTANSGQTDGELFRKKEGIEENYHNLIRVPVCIHVAELVVYTKDKIFPLHGWESLLPYSVDFERGVKAITMNLVAGTRSTELRTIDQAFQKLDAGRTDLVIDIRSNGLRTLQKLGIQGIQVLEPPLFSLESYHYLHVKNRHLLEPLTKALQEMEREGLIKQIQTEVESSGVNSI